MINKDLSYSVRRTEEGIEEYTIISRQVPLAMSYEQLYNEYLKYKELSEQLSAEIDVVLNFNALP